MSDLTQRLRAWAHDERLGHGPLLLDAAAEIERQRQLIEDIDASGIHSCHDRCQRLECVQRREIERLRRERDELRAALGTYGRHSDDCDDANAYNGERRGSCGCGLDEAIAASSADDAPGGGRGCDENW